MTQGGIKRLCFGGMVAVCIAVTGCCSPMTRCGSNSCGETCGDGCGSQCASGGNCDDGCNRGCCCLTGCLNFHSSRMSIPDVLPLGSVVRSHYHTMQTNGEAADFILHRYEFVDHSAELTPYGRDHILEVAARMPQVPFPVLVERSENNANPELDDLRRRLVAQVLLDLGNADAANRTIVSQPYGDGILATEGVIDYSRNIGTRGFGGGGGGGGGFGGGGGGGGGFR